MGKKLAILLLLLGGAAVPSAQAQDDAVVKLLAKHGKLRRGQATRVISQVSKRMKRAADMVQGQNDPLRMAVSQAVLGTPNPPNAMAAAKVRLRLYAGLNGWALSHIFAPRSGVIATCVQAVGLNEAQCAALVAAAGKTSIAQARRRGSGPAAVASGGGAPSRGFGGQPRGYGGQQRGYGGQPSRFGQQPSRFGQQYQPQRPQAQPRYNSQSAPRRAAPRRAASQTNTKEDYKRRREAYLARQKQRMEERKAKLKAIAAGERVQRGPASAEEAEVIGESKSGAAPAAAQAKKPVKAAAEAPAAQAEPKKGKKAKPQLDEGFLDGLLDDPLGGK